jgi:peptide/nickel transport system permease protein
MIIGETSMSFLGLGFRPPPPAGALLLKEALNVTNIVSHPWCLIPLFFVVLTVLAFNFLATACATRPIRTSKGGALNE